MSSIILLRGDGTFLLIICNEWYKAYTGHASSRRQGHEVQDQHPVQVILCATLRKQGGRTGLGFQGKRTELVLGILGVQCRQDTHVQISRRHSR